MIKNKMTINLADELSEVPLKIVCMKDDNNCFVYIWNLDVYALGEDLF